MMNRRQMIKSGAGSLLVTALPFSAIASEEDVQTAMTEIFGDRRPIEGGVTLTLPPIAENGYSVPLDVNVDSPMTEDDYIRQIVILSPRNPIPVLARFYLTPASGLARASTRIRMAGTQRILAVAERSDGQLVSGGAETVVTLAACVIL